MVNESKVSEKACSVCGQPKPHAEFGRHPATRDGLRTECRPCQAVRMRAWRAANPERHRAAQKRNDARRRKKYADDPAYRARILSEHKEQYAALPREKKRRRNRRNALVTNYGLTPEQYDAMAASQDGKCACCGRKPKRLVVDHNHATGAVRGLLCQACNTGIGHLGDTVAGLMRAIYYLERSLRN